MPSADLLIAFVLATSIFAYMPGPSMLYTAAQTIARGRNAGWSAALGIHMGGYVHVVAAAVGLACLFQAIPTLYLALKLMGAGYLVWLGLRMILALRQAGDRAEVSGERTARRAFWGSVSVEVLNPKTATFYVAFFPSLRTRTPRWPSGRSFSFWERS
ncbi:MAG: LysE family translocator [Brevirhabdus sp.]